MAGEGVILRKAREEKGWSYSDVESNIKIRTRYLEALEREEYDILPGKTYTRGFLRTYAKLLGLNSDEIIKLYNQSFDQEPTPEVHAPLTPIQSSPVWFRPIVVVVMAVFAIAIVVGITYLSKNNNSPLASDYTPTPLPSAPQVNNPPQSDPADTPADPQNPSAPADPQTPPPAQYQGIVVELTLKQDCWLRVRVDGVMAMEGISPAGTTRVLQGTRAVEFLTIGNAAGVSLKINGKDVPPLGGAREVITNYVITEETIKAMP